MIIQSKYGIKYTCYKCNCKFYDLNKPEAVCPKCHSNQKDKPKDYDDEHEVVSQRDEELESEYDKDVEDGYSEKDFMLDDDEDAADGKVHTNIEYYDEDGGEGLIKDE